MGKVNLKNSLAGFNCSRRADRENVETFVASYIEAFPAQRQELEQTLPQHYAWVEKFLTKDRPLSKQLRGKHQNHPNVTKIVTAHAKKSEIDPANQWVPKSHYIPDYPRGSFKWQAMRIARDMRIKLERVENGQRATASQ